MLKSHPDNPKMHQPASITLICAALLQLENEEEEELITAVADGLTRVLEAYQDTALPLLEGLMQEIGVLVRPEASVEEKRIGVCIMDDVLEYSAEGRAGGGFQGCRGELGCFWAETWMAGLHSVQVCKLCTQDNVLEYLAEGGWALCLESAQGPRRPLCSVHGQVCPAYLVV